MRHVPLSGTEASSVETQAGPEPTLPLGHFTPEELENRAREVLPRPVYDFAAGAAGEERTAAANLRRLADFVLLPRIFGATGPRESSCTIHGTRLEAPIIVAPMGGQCMYHPDGERAVARAAARVGVGFMLSTASSVSLEDVADTPDLQAWFQLYWQPSRRVTVDLVNRARAAGYRGICVTVDWTVRPIRRRDVANGFRRPPGIPFANLDRYGRVVRSAQRYGLLEPDAPFLDPPGTSVHLDWDAIEWLREQTDLPLILKGILTPSDAERALSSGVDGIVVSNHGGRYLDSLPASIDALMPVAQAVGSRTTVLFDSGIRRASDILIAVALGARAVLVGRPILWALATGGEEGVYAYLSGLRSAFQQALTVVGAGRVESLDAHFVADARSMGWAQA